MMSGTDQGRTKHNKKSNNLPEDRHVVVYKKREKEKGGITNNIQHQINPRSECPNAYATTPPAKAGHSDATAVSKAGC